MSQFNVARFSLLWRAHWAEYLRTYTVFFGVCIVLYYIMALIAFITVGSEAFEIGAQTTCFFGGLFVTGGVFAMRFYEGLSRKGAGLLILMRPASTFEKWLLAVVMLIVVYPLLYSLIYCVVNIPTVQLAKQIAMSVWRDSYAVSENPNAVFNGEKYTQFVPFLSSEFADQLNLHRQVQSLLLVVFIATQAFMFAGSLYFKRLAMFKTVLVGFLLLLTYVSFLVITRSDPSPLVAYWFATPEDDADISTTVNIIALVAWFVTPALLWSASYFYLKQRETV